jgi:hypothetical protein
MRIRWHTWLTVLAAVLAAGEGLGVLLIAQGAVGVGQTVRWAGRFAATGWIVFALVRWNHVIWVRRLSFLIGATLFAGLVALIFNALEITNGVIATLGIYGMAVGFSLGLLAIRAVLEPGSPILGVARTLIDEAMRMKVPLVFIVAVLVLIPALPFAMDPGEKLQYRIQSFLSWSFLAVSALLSLMTVFLAVGTITSEMNRRQIYLTLTKPLGRAQYLAGKWLGIGLLNVLLIGVSGAGVYVFTLMLANQEATTVADRQAVQQQVLAARVTRNPDPPDGNAFRQRMSRELERARREDPDRFGEPGEPLEVLDAEARQLIRQRTRDRWYSLAPQSSTRFLFVGLDEVGGEQIQFRLKPQAGGTPDNMVRLRMRVNGEPYRVPEITDEQGRIALARDKFHVLNIPASRITDEGEVMIQLTNPTYQGEDQPSIRFNTTDGLQMLYRVGGFELNLARSLGLVWLQLCYLAILGLAAGSVLGFPVASVLCLLVYFTAFSSAFLTESMGNFAYIGGEAESLWDQIANVLCQVSHHLAQGEVWSALKIGIRLIGSGFMMMVPAFEQFNPAPLISSGRLVSYALLGSALGKIGVLWCGLTAGIGYLLFRRKELARITV